MSCVSLPWLCWFQMWNLWIQNPCYHENHVRSEIAVQSDVLPSSCDQQSTCCYQVAVEVPSSMCWLSSTPGNLPCLDTYSVTTGKSAVSRHYNVTTGESAISRHLPCCRRWICRVWTLTVSPPVNLPCLDTYIGDCHHHWCWWWLMMVGMCRGDSCRTY